MKKGTSKYNGNFPFKFFICGKIGHYASRCPNRDLNNKNKENKGKMILRKVIMLEEIQLFLMMNLIMKMIMMSFCSLL